MKLRHVGIVCSDIDKSLLFYKNYFKAEILADCEESGDFLDFFLGYKNLKIRTIKMKIDDGVIELIYFETNQNNSRTTPELNKVGITHIAITVDNVIDLYNRMVCDGVNFVSEPRKSPNGKVCVFFAKDPDENFLELVEELC